MHIDMIIDSTMIVCIDFVLHKDSPSFTCTLSNVCHSDASKKHRIIGQGSPARYTNNLSPDALAIIMFACDFMQYSMARMDLISMGTLI